MCKCLWGQETKRSLQQFHKLSEPMYLSLKFHIPVKAVVISPRFPIVSCYKESHRLQLLLFLLANLLKDNMNLQ